jgi:glucose/arabinose dehydrogenase
MNRKYLYLLTLMLTLLFFLTFCRPVQEKPDISAGLSTNESSANTESADTVDENSSINGSETVKSTVSNLRELQELGNSFTIADAFPGISFNRPVDLQNSGDGTGRLFVVEQSGRIFIIDSQTSKKSDLFLDISSRVDDSSNEKGLLGLAFHPDFKKNGQFFVNYTNKNNTVISRFMISSNNPNRANPDSEEILITFPQPYQNHNGGQLAFGPNDGYLYIAVGDGGGAGDPQGNGQNRKTLLGKILRIDIDKKDLSLNYSIPSDNPFKGGAEGYREEIYAYGLRNPWRFSFDADTSYLWLADVGQDKIEEIDIIQKGKNYGWNIMEGSYCYKPPSGCDPAGLELPIYEYSHPLGESITGGYVYHGKMLPVLQDVYVYGDFVTGYIWALAYIDRQKVQNFTLVKTDLNISSFGIDEEKELYFTAFDGKIYKLTMLQ